MKQRREPPTDEQLDAVVGWLVDHMREHLQRAEMDASPEAVREACRRRLRARLATQALASTQADAVPGAAKPSRAAMPVMKG